MNAVVVDTNVPVTANGKADHAGSDCTWKCVERLRHIKDSCIVVLDNRWRILQEYQRRLSPSGQPGPGDAFLKWVFVNQANPNHCELVQITSNPQSDENFVEFPNDPNLNGFDPDDRKFVAVALTSVNRPTIQNAVDRGWWKYQAELGAHGVQIEFICPEIMKIKRRGRRRINLRR